MGFELLGNNDQNKTKTILAFLSGSSYVPLIKGALLERPNTTRMTKGYQLGVENQMKSLNGAMGEETEKSKEFDDDVHVGFIPSEEGHAEAFHDKEEENRHMWSTKVEYLLTMMGYLIGLGTVWRVPYTCIRNGGGAFLIPFFACLIICGIPLFFLEVGMGQFAARGALHVWGVCPLFRGMGISMNVLSLVCSWYYSMILAWTLIYMANSFRSPLPWSQCGQDWNTDHCVLVGHAGSGPVGNGSGMGDLNMTTGFNSSTGLSWSNATSSVILSDNEHVSTREFFKYNILELSPGFEHMDGLIWKNALALFISSLIVCACVVKGVKTVGKVVYVTATLPYVLLTILMVEGATLDGAIDGIIFYVKPDFSKLLEIRTWVEASVQAFYSLGPSWGGLITMGSYNKFNNNCLRDAVVLTFVCEGTAIFAGFAIFPIIGHMAHALNVPVANFSSIGPGLAFVVYPEAINYLPVPQLWAVLFFLMLFTLALDTQFTMVETCLTTIYDIWPKFVARWEIWVKITFCVILFLCSLPFASRGGMYLFQISDWYCAAFTICLNGILECIVIGWIYGAERFVDDLQLMLGKRPPYLFVILWRFVTPVILLVILVSTLLVYEPPTYEGYTYGVGGVALGWFIAVISVVPLPVYAIYKLFTTKGTLLQRLKTSCSPSADWRPADTSLRDEYRLKSKHTPICSFRLPCSNSISS